MRDMINLLSLGLFGKSIPLAEFPDSKSIRGIGMSDWLPYATRLAEKFDYVNTYYHQKPFLDITKIDDSQAGQYDFILSTDVFEHVTPPVSIAFSNTYKLLRDNGVFVFSVPYSLEPETVEHFPELHDFKILGTDGQYRLENITAKGDRQVFHDLIFHGGPGSTLEMRLFSLADLQHQLSAAGFSDVQVMSEPCFEHGIWHRESYSLPILARKGGRGIRCLDFGPHALAIHNTDDSDCIWIRLNSAVPDGASVDVGDFPATDLVHDGTLLTCRVPAGLRRKTGSFPIAIRFPNMSPVPVGHLYLIDEQK